MDGKPQMRIVWTSPSPESVAFLRRWPAGPTTETLMIAAATALAPKRLIIGGMDLIQHAEGRCPVDMLSRNEPARAHSRDVDPVLIDLALRDYRGELVILSDILCESLGERMSGQADAVRREGERGTCPDRDATISPKYRDPGP